MLTAFRDHRGELWFGTYKGLSRFAPEPERPASPPPTLIGGVRIAGRPYPVSDLGATEISGLEFGADQKQISIDFYGIISASASAQISYKLEAPTRLERPGRRPRRQLPESDSGHISLRRAGSSADGTLSPAPPSSRSEFSARLAALWFCARRDGRVRGDRRRRALPRRADARVNAALGRSEKLTEVLTERAPTAQGKPLAGVGIRRHKSAGRLHDARRRDAKSSTSDLRAYGWEVGTLWEVDAQGRCCVRRHVAPAAGRRAAVRGYSRSSPRAGVGLPGRLWQSGEPYGSPTSPRILTRRGCFAVEEGSRAPRGSLPARDGGDRRARILQPRVARPDEEQIKMVSATAVRSASWSSASAPKGRCANRKTTFARSPNLRPTRSSRSTNRASSPRLTLPPTACSVTGWRR